ncbi:Mog1p/PsbP-like protein [Fragilariopsis cylindrus CCMP1102]|uniref:Mog1p/PsbP-like protein n=1 Tax=Fragilariopsis cylindrus CCMP1102 TaxID=635003 RepID=A0A1E7FRW8_9STRA|nr:Mog1p/PsbP-like protein [Fragilariopsis cylindrus CCMP1102]|eukprot:OEU20888.1 Mog1p/PsbP-like protein [Fragilariopsis cylindrus CCMP1102]
MMKGATIAVSCAVLLVAQTSNEACAFSVDQLSRRESLQALIGGVATAIVPSVVSILPALAAEGDEEAAVVAEVAPEVAPEVAVAPKVVYHSALTEETPRSVTRMGGLLESFQDGNRSIRMMVPSGWNKFDGEVGAYDIKWQDLVDKSENIKISSTPVKSSTTSIEVLGEVQGVGVNLASKRNAKLVKATERLTDDVLFYRFEFAINDGTHQLLQLCVCKGKLWSIDASSTEKRWSKRAELYDNVFTSFMPKLA